MRVILKILVLVFLFVSIVSAQEMSREQKLQRIAELADEIKSLEVDVLLPDARDLARAQKGGVNVFRLLPRERYDHKLQVQGGGSFYSFTTRYHDYQKISQIGLEQDYLSTGFAGADYGLIADLGEAPLADLTREKPEVDFLLNYKIPTFLKDVRSEQRKSHNYEINGLQFKSRLFLMSSGMPMFYGRLGLTGQMFWSHSRSIGKILMEV